MKVKDVLVKIKPDMVEYRKTEEENCVFAVEDVFTYKKVFFFFNKPVCKRKLIIYYKQ